MSEIVTSQLVFEAVAPATSQLVFGDTGGSAGTPAVNVTITGTLPGLTVEINLVPPAEIDLIGVLPPLTLTAALRPSQPVAITGVLPGLEMVAEVLYETNTSRPTVSKTDAQHQVANKQQGGLQTGQQVARKAPEGWEAFWQRVTGGSQNVQHRLPRVLSKRPINFTGRQQDATRSHLDPLFRHQDGTPIWQERVGLYQEAEGHRLSTFFSHQDGTPRKLDRSTQWQNSTQHHKAGHSGSFQTAKPLSKDWWTLFQDGVPPPPGLTVFLPPGEPPPPSCYDKDDHLVYQVPFSNDTHLVFICDGYVDPEPPVEPIIVPVQRVYIVLNNIALRRTSDNAVVPAFRFSLSLDVSSWSWGFSASLPATSQALVEPTTGPVELSAWVNGQEFRVLAEQVGRERAFGQATISISGRGRNAFLDAPYAPVQTFGNTTERTHQQLFDDVLTFNGVPMGWSVDYGLEAWNIPAGVWSHQGTYIGALNALAQAGGAYLIPHPSAQSFKLRHLYPTKPWEWGTVTPDFVLPADVVSREGLTWKEKPAYNRVYVSGEGQGVLGRVTRQGTAGDLLAPMVTDPLITTAAAARQRGLAVLGDTGKQIEHQLRLPVLQSTGIIQPGAFIEYEDGGSSRIGIVRSTQVDAQMPDVWQTLGVEVHDYA